MEVGVGELGELGELRELRELREWREREREGENYDLVVVYLLVVVDHECMQCIVATFC